MVVVGPPLSSSLSEDEDDESESEFAANHFDILLCTCKKLYTYYIEHKLQNGFKTILRKHFYFCALLPFQEHLLKGRK